MNIAVPSPSADVVPDKGDTKRFIIGPFTRLAIVEFCDSQGDTNPFHRYPESAQRMCARVRLLPRGAVVVPGMQIMAAFPRVVVGWLGLGATFTGIRRLSIHMPAASDEPIVATMAIERRAQAKDGVFYEISAVAKVDELSKPTLTAKFRMFVPTPGTVV